jgi:MYXO-CTERM domain-containing protein
MSLVLTTFSATVLAAALWSPWARADDADKAACADKEEGDACMRGDGGSGTCVPDDSEPVLTCEDSIGGADDSGGDDDDDASGCSVGASQSPGGAVLMLLLVAGLSRRRGVLLGAALATSACATEDPDDSASTSSATDPDPTGTGTTEGSVTTTGDETTAGTSGGTTASDDGTTTQTGDGTSSGGADETSGGSDTGQAAGCPEYCALYIANCGAEPEGEQYDDEAECLAVCATVAPSSRPKTPRCTVLRPRPSPTSAASESLRRARGSTADCRPPPRRATLLAG